MNPLLQFRVEKVRYWLDAPAAHRDECEHLRLRTADAPDKGTACVAHMYLGALCWHCWITHCTEFGCDTPLCDSCGVIPVETDSAFASDAHLSEDATERVVETTTTNGWTGELDIKVWRLCWGCFARRSSINIVVTGRMNALTGIVQRWVDEGAPGHESAAEFGWCIDHPEGIRTRAGLLIHNNEHPPTTPLCAACDRAAGTVARTGTANTKYGLVYAAPLAHFCAECDRTDPVREAA